MKKTICAAIAALILPALHGEAQSLPTNAVTTTTLTNNLPIFLSGPFGVAPDGTLCGVSEVGGSGPGNHDLGEVFLVNPTTGSIYDVVSLTDTTGELPLGGISSYGNTFFGSTALDGTNSGGEGSIFKMDTNGTFTLLYEFTSAYGSPTGPPITRDGVMLYGTVTSGGASGDGGVYAMTNGGAIKSFNSLGGTNGELPEAAMTFFPGDPNLYSVASEGGKYGYGTIFEFNPSNSAITKLYDFTNGTDGANPETTLAVLPGDTNDLYGTTAGTNSYNKGTVFGFNKATGMLTTLHSFSSPVTAYPAQLQGGIDGAFYGTTVYSYYMGYSGTNLAVMYRLSPGGSYTPLATNTYAPGLTFSPKDNAFYGITGQSNSVYSVIQTSVPMPTAITTEQGSSNGVSISFVTVKNLTYELQGSSNLAGPWTDVAQVTATNGSTTAIDSSKYMYAFYRPIQNVSASYYSIISGAQLNPPPVFMLATDSDWSSFPTLELPGSSSTNGPPVP